MKGSLTEALLAVHDVLANAGVKHALCGGLAANLYRDEVRATSDVDLAVILSPTRSIELVGVLSDAGWTAEPYWRKSEQLRLTRAELPRVDCIIATTDYERAAIDRAVQANIEGTPINVLSAEDLIIFKLMAGRARDFEAVAAIINTLGDRLDTDYITGWLEQFGVPDVWLRAKEEAKREAGEW